MTETEEGAIAIPIGAERGPDWDALYRVHAGALLRYLRRLTRSQEVAEELMQEAFARAIRARRFPAVADEVRPWLYRIAANVAIDHLRRQRRFSFVPFMGREPATEVPTDEADLVRRALWAIPPEQATALVLRLHEGFSPAEIAAMLGIGEAGVKSRLARGRQCFIKAYLRIGGRL